MLWELLLDQYVPVFNNTCPKQLHFALDKSRVVPMKKIEATSANINLKVTKEKLLCLKLILQQNACILLSSISQIKGN